MPEQIQQETQNILDGTPLQLFGVAGWLLVFCIVSLFIGVVGSLKAIHDSTRLFWIAIYIVLMIFDLGAGISAWSRSKSALTFVRLDLMVTLIYAVMQVYWGFQIRAQHCPEAMVALEFKRAIFHALYAFAWFWYFRVSTRVRRTFGKNI